MKKEKKQMIATAVLKALFLALIAVSGRPTVEESHAMRLHVCLPGNTLTPFAPQEVGSSGWISLPKFFCIYNIVT